MFAVVIGIKLGVFVVFGFYNRWWRYVSTRDMWGAVRGVTVACLLSDLVLYAFPPDDTSQLPKRIVALDYLLLLAFVAGTRLLARSLIERPKGGIVARGKEVLVVGAGDAGQLLVREMQRNPRLAYTPVGFVDDDPRKKNLRIHGVRVLGTTDELGHLIRDHRPDEVLIAMPSAPGELRRKIVEATRAEGIPVKTLPGLHELIAGDVEPRRPDPAGAGRGRARARAGRGRPRGDRRLHPRPRRARDRRRRLDRLRALPPGRPARRQAARARRQGRVGALRDAARARRRAPLHRGDPGARRLRRRARTCAQVFERYPPEVVFHAAAYKHVPMLETNPIQAVTNNVLATRVIAQVAVEFGVERFVFISTDKAAKPKNLLGQSKAVCEWIVESFAQRDDVATRFVAVRFGNVLGSSGSVIPIFRRQIERGGPVTVTNPEMTRFFMTIPEAASLVIQAGAMGGRGQVYVLDMGQPVKILDLARQMIELSGRTEDEIKIEFVGSRHGEKMHEVLWNDDEEVGADQAPEDHAGDPAADRPVWLDDELAELEALVAENDVLGVTAKLRLMVAAPKRVGSDAVLEDTLH